MINIDKFAYSSRLRRVEPMEKFIFSMLTLAVCLWADLWVVSIIVSVVMMWAAVRRGGTPFTFYMKLLLVPMTFLIIGVVTIAVNLSSAESGFLLAFPVGGKWLGVSRAGLYEAGGLFLKTLGAVSCLYFLSLTTPLVDILSVLKRLKVPTLMIELMSLIYRFIFVLMDTASVMITAQHSRLGYINLASGYRSLALLASTLFIRAYKRSSELYDSLEARGYDGELNVIEESFDRSNKLYAAAVALNIVLILAALFIK